MKKILFLLLCTLSLFSCGFQKKVYIEAVKETIIEGERAQIPLHIQEFENVFEIQIDSIVLTNNVSPYTGYLVTLWDLNEKQNLSTQQWVANGYKDKYIRKTKTVYVPITNAIVDMKNNTVQWNSGWNLVYYDVRKSD